MAKPNDDRVRGPRSAAMPALTTIPPQAWEHLRVAFSWSKREAEVAQLLFDGCKEATIARRLKISYQTGKKHVDHVYRKMNVHSRADFTRELMIRYLQLQQGDATYPGAAH